MVEGHQCHRVAHFHRQKMLNRAFKATSPNGRFSDGAAAINDQPLSRIEVHGKNLFYFFGPPQNESSQVVVHIHFGMSGAFSLHSLDGNSEPSSSEKKKANNTKTNDKTTPKIASEANQEEPSEEEEQEIMPTTTSAIAVPATKPTTRLQLLNKDFGLVAHLSAMTVQHGSLDLYHSKASSLGEDPLREDADPEIAWSKISISKKPIGLLLMDQSVIAGVGNIYRAEILYKSGVHPEQPGHSLTRPTFDTIWTHSVELLQRGFQSGSILTVDADEALVLGQPWTRRYCYNHSSCGRCRGKILSWDMAGRKVYCCTTCQPLVGVSDGTTTSGTGNNKKVVVLPAARKKAMGTAIQAVEFVSHCAPDDGKDKSTPLSKLKVAELKTRAEAIGLSTSGKKADLVARLEAATAAAARRVQTKEEEATKEEDAGLATTAAGVEVEGVPTPQPASKRAKHAAGHESSKRTTSPSSATPATPAAPAVYPEVYTWDHTTVSEEEEISTTSGEGTVRAVPVLPKSGTAGIKKVATAREAALEKARAGEGRGVEHVALHDDEEERALERISGVEKNNTRSSGRKRKPLD